MKRRDFLKSSVYFPAVFSGISILTACKTDRQTSEQLFEFLEVEGSYRQIGYQIGKRFRWNIQEIIKRREVWFKNLQSILSTKEGKDLSDILFQKTQKHFPHILEELQGLADGAGLAFQSVWAMSIKSELETLESEPDDCSTIYYKDEHHNWLFHNEDGNKAYSDLMFMLKVIPPSGTGFISLIYPGLLAGNGPSLNAQGIIQTTNFISSTWAAEGLPRYIIGRAALEAKTAEEAIQIVTTEPRSFPYHHNIGCINSRRYYSIETTPQSSACIEPSTFPYIHTNHLIHTKTKAYSNEDLEYKRSSSLSRFQVLTENVKMKNQFNYNTAEELLKFLSSHQNAPYSPCRHPKNEVSGKTLATAFFDLAKGFMNIYRGNPCRSVADGDYKQYSF